MRIPDVIKLSFKSVKRGGVKTLLCAFSVFTGVFFICGAAVVSDISGKTVNNELEEIGLKGSALYSSSGESLTLDKDELLYLGKTSGVKEIMPFIFETGSVKLNKNIFGAIIVGVDGKLQDVWNVKLLYGRGFKGQDTDSKTAIIDEELSKSVYKRSNVVGKSVYVTVNGVTDKYEIIGVSRSQKKGLQSILGASVPEIVYLPSKAVGRADKLAVICRDGYESAEVCASLSQKIYEISGIKYEYKDLDVYKDSFVKIGKAVSYLASALGATALLAGGAGVMTNMSASAERRRKEIGIFISQGASEKDIALLFLYEAVIICLFGGGAACGIFAALLSVITPEKTVMLKSGASGLLASVVCGGVFGIIPALRAAGLKPADTIRE